jgi:hypothetical protein
MWKVTHTVGEHLCDVVPGPPTGRVWQPPWKGIAAGEKRALPGAVSCPTPPPTVADLVGGRPLRQGQRHQPATAAPRAHPATS